METLEKGKQKLGEICDLLRRDTLEPAEKEAAALIESGKKEKERLLNEAKNECAKLIEEAQKKIQKERVLFNTSLDVASKQAFDKLREEIESKLFHQELSFLVHQITHDAEMVGKLVSVLVESIEKEGLHGDLTLTLSKSLRPEDVSKQFVKNIAERLKKEAISVGTMTGGAVIHLKDEAISVDISDQSLKELLGSYLRASFREILFKNV